MKREFLFGLGGHWRVFPDFADFILGEQGCAFDETTESFLADAMMCPLARQEVGDRFVLHFQPFQLHEPDILIALFPDLVLRELHFLNLMKTRIQDRGKRIDCFHTLLV